MREEGWRGWRQLLWTLTSLLCLAGGGECHGPSTDFHHHDVITPRLYHGRGKREVGSSLASGQEGGHHHHLTLGFSMRDRDYVLDLQLNRDLLPENYFEKYHHKLNKGEYVINRPTKKSIELCHYKGRLRGRADSWAALSTCDGLHGVIFDGEVLHHVEPSPDRNDTNNDHFVYNHEDVTATNRSCGFHDTPSHWSLEEVANSAADTGTMFDPDTFNRMLRYKRDISVSRDEPLVNGKVDVKGPWNANKRSRYVELVIVVDNRKFKENDSNLKKVYRKCKEMANIANALYAPLNIYIALVGVVVWSEYDEITLSTNGDTTLTNFLHYRRERLVKEHPNDNAQLLTGIQFDSGVVGKALKGPICTYEFSGGVSMWHSDVIGLVATTMAHEMGHNFGMEHDTENCKCPDERCIMAPASSTMRPSFWSSCSLEYLALAFEHGMDYCLRNKPRTLFDSPVCGNGFVEPGEECDCGLRDHCDNPCCNPDTCQMFANATCATGECCDFKTCRPKTPGEMCRLSEHECDLPEYCTGESEFCPKDIFKVDGIPCKVGEAFCYQGTCRTHSDQCRLLWGPSGKKSDNQCYEQNRKGSRHGNCGYNRLNQSYVPCNQGDVRCGMLHCSHLNERLEFGMESVAILSHSFINTGGRIIPCRTALVDLGLDDVDPGLAPEGSRCSDDSLCVNRKCMPVASLKIGPQSCPNDCNGRGLCNSLGHCHCEEGWAPPFCDSPGLGGSLDSGPASNPDRGSTVFISTILYILLPLVMLIVILCVIFYMKGDIHAAIKKSKQEEGFIKVERRRNSRPPSRLNIDAKDISGPISVETSNSVSSSPTHALLPRSTTQTSDIDDQTTAGNNSNTEPPEVKRGGLFANNVFSGLGGFSYRKSQESKIDAISESPPDSLTDSSGGVIHPPGGGYKTRTSNLLKSLNKSLSFPTAFPSPKFRSSIKKPPAETNNKYEVKIEPRQHIDESPVGTSQDSIAVTDGKVAWSQENGSAVVSATTAGTSPTAADLAVKPMPSSFKPTPSVAGSSSFSTFLNNNRGGSKASTLPPSMSLGQVVPVVNKVETQVTLEKKGHETKTSPSSTPSQQTQVDFRLNPKLAFPHSSSYTRDVSNSKAELILPESKSVGSFSNNPKKGFVLSAANELSNGRKSSNPTSFINRNSVAANKSVAAPYTANIQPLQSPFFKKPSLPSVTTTNNSEAKPTSPVTTVTVSPFSQEPTALSSKVPASTTSPPTTATSPPSASTAKHTIWSAMESSSRPTTLPPVSKVESKLSKQASPPVEAKKTQEEIKLTVVKPVDSKPPVPPTTTTTTSLSPVKPTAAKPTTSTPSPAPAVKPTISRPIFQTATPNAASLIAKAPSTGVSQFSILSGGKDKDNPDPFKPPREKGRRAVFCDPITLPSPTSPNTPPIIHQPHGPSSTDSTVGKIITPTWSVQPLPVATQAQVCHIAGGTPERVASPEGKFRDPLQPAGEAAPAAAKDKSGLSKLISNVKRTPSLGVADRPGSSAAPKDKPEKPSTLPRKPKIGRPDRNSLNIRSLEISNPVLQTNVDSKLQLVPVCRSPDIESPPPGAITSTAPSEPTGHSEPGVGTAPRQGSPSSKRPAPQPPQPKPGSAAEASKPPKNDDIVSPVKGRSSSKYNLPWRSASRTSKPDNSTASSPDSVPKSSSNDLLESSKNSTAHPPPGPASVQRSGSSSTRRPASIATSKPIRPNAPPPKPPPTRAGSHETSPEDIYIYDDASAIVRAGRASSAAPLANIDESVSPEPIYDTISEERETVLSPGESFETPLGSPTLTKKSPDTLSTGSSAEEDLMKEILREVHTKTEGESIYSSLMRKDKKKRRKAREAKTAGEGGPS